MVWLPVKLSSHKRASGWKPERGWYCVDPDLKVADLGVRFDKKSEARVACKIKSRQAPTAPAAAPTLTEEKKA